MQALKNIVHKLLSVTPYQIGKKWPTPTLDAVKLLMAYYVAAGRPVTLVQVGAADGVSHDPIHHFIHQPNVKSLLIEPLPASFQKLQKRYANNTRVTVVQAAIASSNGHATMYRCKPEKSQQNWDQFTSFDKDHLLRHGLPPDAIEEIVVSALTLPSVLDSHEIREIDLLQVDAEGFDAEIVKMALSLRSLPRAINFERRHLPRGVVNELYEQLTAKDYLFINDDFNSLAIQKTLEEKLSGASL